MRYSALSVAVCTLALAACAKQAGLPAEDVLNRSSVANRGLLSAHIVVTARISSVDAATGSLDASGIVEGNMQQGGNQLDLAFNTQGARVSGQQSLTWKATGRVIVLSPQESYMSVENLETSPTLPMFALPEFQNFVGTWYKLPSTSAPSPTLTPDPRLLRLQSDAVRVTKDHGIQNMDGKSMYHYDVVIDPRKLSTYLQESGESSEDMMAQLSKYDATGELWIDATTFLLTKAVWNVKQKDVEGPVLTLSMSLSDPGLQVTVTAPTNAQPFPQTPLFPTGNTTFLQEF